MCPAIVALSEIRHTRVALSERCWAKSGMKRGCFLKKEIESQSNFGYTHNCLWLRALSGPEVGYIQLLRTTVRGNCQSYEKIVRSYSCPHWVQLLFIIGSSLPGAFFSPIGSGPGGSGLWNGDRDKHWVQLLFISGSSSPGAVFFSYWIWARGQRLVEWG